MVVSVGFSKTDKVCVPAAGTVPTAGLYVNVPATPEDAFNCVELSAVPARIDAGVAQEIVGVAWFTTIVTDAVWVL